MYIYSVTIHIQKAAEQDWITYMQTKHIADVLNTGCFQKAVFKKVLGTTDADFSSLCTDYFTDSLETHENYIKNYAPTLQNDVLEKFDGKFTAERKLYAIEFEV